MTILFFFFFATKASHDLILRLTFFLLPPSADPFNRVAICKHNVSMRKSSFIEIGDFRIIFALRPLPRLDSP